MMKNINKSGFTILEILVALAISSILMVAGAQLSDAKSKDITDQNTAQYHSMINNSAMKYIQSISGDIQADASVTLTSPRVINFNEIRTAGFIPNQFINAETNPYGQSVCIFVYKDPANLNDISALVVSEGGQDIPVGRLPHLSTLIGPAGGYIHPNTPAVASGAYAKWTKPIPNLNCSGQQADGNHLASQIYFDGSDLTQNFLYRSEVPGHPEANEMNAPLIMNAESAADGTCSKLGSISRSSTGALLTCSGTSAPYKWNLSESAFWKNAVNTYANLTTFSCTALNHGETRLVKTPSTGVGSRAYSCNGAGNWVAIAIDDTGNLNLPGTASFGKVKINDAVAENSPCASNGLIATDSTGLILSCQGGTFKKSGGEGVSDFGEYRYASMSNGGTFCSSTGQYSNRCVQGNPKTSACSCPAGSSATVTASSQNALCEPGYYGSPNIYEYITTYACKKP